MKNIIRVFMIVAIAVGLWSVMQLTASADTTNSVMYKDADGNTSAAPECKIVESSGAVDWDGGWYAVTKNTVITGRITLRNDVNLILCDGAKLTVSPDYDSNGISMLYYNLNVFEGKTTRKFGGTLDVSANGEHEGLLGDGSQGEIGIFGGTVLANYDSDTHTAKNGSSSGISTSKITIGGGATVCSYNGQSTGIGMYGANEIKIFGSDTKVYVNCSLNGDKVSLTEGAGGVGIYCDREMEITDAVVYSYGGVAPFGETGCDGIIAPIKMSGLSSLTAVGGKGAESGDAIHGQIKIPSYLDALKSMDGKKWQTVSSDELLNGGILSQYGSIKPHEYSLVYDPTEGYGTIKPIAVAIDQMYEFPQCTFERPDKKIFDYWEMTGVDGLFKPGDTTKIAINCLLDGKITVKAHWVDAPQAEIKTDVTAKDLKYNGKTQELVTAGTAENGVMQYAVGTNSTTAPRFGWSKSIPQKTAAGTYYVWYRAYGDALHSNSDAKCCTAVIKGLNDNTLSIKGKTIKVKYKKLKKKTQKIKTKKYIKYKNKGQGKLTYKLVKVKKAKFKKYFKINKKTGKLTIKKKLKKGKYKVTVKIKAAGNADYKPSAWKKITIKVKVK